MAAAPVGLIANPASGKDIRRLVAHASVFDNEEKRNIVRRVILGAAAAGADRFLAMPEPNQLIESAVDGLETSATVDLSPHRERRAPSTPSVRQSPCAPPGAVSS